MRNVLLCFHIFNARPSPNQLCFATVACMQEQTGKKSMALFNTDLNKVGHSK